jgi:formylglycine-generating enzyme required for sulfatase activity
MRARNDKRTHVAWTAFLSVLAQLAGAQDRGALRLRTDPDSALVVLDDTRDAEAQRTPYANESMIPGPHAILLRPGDPAFRSAKYVVDISAGRTTTLDHVFEYRTKATGMELLSVAPWKLEIGSGVRFQSYLGRQGEANATSASAGSSSAYPSDSVPTSLDFPFQMRLGVPGGFEAHAAIPLAEKSAPGNSASLSLGDVQLGAKWTCSFLDAAVDATYSVGSVKQRNLGSRSDAATITLIANRRYSMLHLSANLGYCLRFHSMDTSVGVPGDVLHARVRVGALLADQILPLVQISGDYGFPGTKDGATVAKTSVLLTVSPGFVWYAGRSLSLEFGVPLGLVASNEETRWGMQGSFAWGFSLGATRFADAKSSAAAPEPSSAPPANISSHVLFSSTEVTVAQYKEFCEKTGRELPADPEFSSLPGYFSDPKYGAYPVVNVSIADARAYAAWAGKRLPTVGEWRREMEGLDPSNAEVACGLDAPEPVSAREPVAGLRDMLGNVAEWVENDRSTGSVAYMAGGFFSLPRERCLDKGRWIDVASPTGARYIGFRVATDVK